jgi:RNA recognition motif-containing protein
MTDPQLRELFQKHNVSGGHVVMDRLNRSKGFGFVEFQSEDDQKAALALNKTVVGGRELTVKIALNFERNNPPSTTDSSSSSSPSTSSSSPRGTPASTTPSSPPPASSPKTDKEPKPEASS